MSITGKTVLPHRYDPRGACRAAVQCRDDEVLISGPAGTGKSRAALEKLHMMALLNPGMRGLIVRKTLASLGSTALVTWREHVIPEALTGGLVKYYGGSREEPPQYVYVNGSKIMIGGMDKATRVMSSEYDVIYVQEAIELTQDDWESLVTRLRNGKVSFQQIIADTNPDVPTHWLKARERDGRTTVIESRHEDNPILFDDSGKITERGKSYMGRLDNLTGVRHARLRRGLWVAAEGQIYEEWDPAVHLIKRFIVPKSWPRYWAVDFGFTHPFVCQFWAEDPDGRLFMYREIYRTGRTVDQHAAEMLGFITVNRGVRRAEPEPQAVICDHDAEGQAVLRRELGFPIVNAKKAVITGIEEVKKRLRPAKDGKPRLYIMRDTVNNKDATLIDARKPTCTAEELPGYVWAVDGKGHKKEEPLKEEDDGCDAMRYMVMHRAVGSGGVRFF